MRARLLAIVGLSAALSLANAEGNSPASKSSIARAPEQQQPVDNRGTSANPLVVKPLPTDKSTDERRQDAIDREEHSRNESETLLWAKRLAWLTGLMALIAAAQVGLFWWQLILIREGTKDAGDAAVAAKQSAEALPLIERAYVFLESSKIVMQSAATTTRDATSGEQVSQLELSILFSLKNHGKTPAILDELFAEARVVPNFNAAKDASGTPFAPGMVLSAGETMKFNASFKVDPVQFAASKTQGGPLLLFFGSVSYQDVLRQRRATGFCWKCGPENPIEFQLSLDPDHNYWT